jgi:hypothetical protein
VTDVAWLSWRTVKFGVSAATEAHWNSSALMFGWLGVMSLRFGSK